VGDSEMTNNELTKIVAALEKIWQAVKNDKKVEVILSINGDALKKEKKVTKEKKEKLYNNNIHIRGGMGGGFERIKQSFDIFWKAYPRKVSKKKALEYWLKKDPPINRVLQTLEAYKKTDQWKDHSFVPHPSTWLNQERWEDEVMTKPDDRDKPVVRDTMDPETKRLIDEFTSKHSLK